MKCHSSISLGRVSQRSYPIWLFCLGLEDATIRALLELLFLALDLEPPALWLWCCEDEDGKLSGLMTRGIFFSPLSRALAMASEIIRLAFSCLSSERGDSICCCCCRFFTRFSDTDAYEGDEEEEEELLFTGGLSTRTWLLGPLVFLGGYDKKEKERSYHQNIIKVYKIIFVYLWMDSKWTTGKISTSFVAMKAGLYKKPIDTFPFHDSVIPYCKPMLYNILIKIPMTQCTPVWRSIRESYTTTRWI